MKNRFLYYFRFWSLDIVLGVVAGSLFAASVFNITLLPSYIIIIALSTWIIYFADHIIDGIKAGPEAKDPERRAFYKYKIPFIVIAFILAVFDFRYILYVLSPDIIQFGIVLLMAVGVYFMLQLFYGKTYKLFFIKELWVAIIYTLAIWGGPVIYYGHDIRTAEVLIICVYGLLVLSNVLIFSYFEVGDDRDMDKKTFATDFGIKLTRAIIYIVNSLAFILIIVVFFFYGRLTLLPFLILLLMNIGLMVVALFPRYFNIGRRYGIVTDGLFLLPFVVLIM